MVLLDLLHVQRASFFDLLKLEISKELSQLNINLDNTRLQTIPFNLSREQSEEEHTYNKLDEKNLSFLNKRTHNSSLIDFRLIAPKYSPREAIICQKSWSCKLVVKILLSVYGENIISKDFTISQNKKKQINNHDLWPDVALQNEIFYKRQNYEFFLLLGELPLMTKRGHFIINGSPRVILSQLVRTPGIYFMERNNEIQVDCVPQQGPWLSFYKNLRDKSLKYGTYYCFSKQYLPIPLTLMVNSFQIFEIYSQFTDQSLLLIKLKTLEKILIFKEYVGTLLTFTLKKRARKRLKRCYKKKCNASTQHFEKIKQLFRIKKKLILNTSSRKSFSEKLGISSCFTKDFTFFLLPHQVHQGVKSMPLNLSLVDNQFLTKEQGKETLLPEKLFRTKALKYEGDCEHEFVFGFECDKKKDFKQNFKVIDSKDVTKNKQVKRFKEYNRLIPLGPEKENSFKVNLEETIDLTSGNDFVYGYGRNKGYIKGYAFDKSKDDQIFLDNSVQIMNTRQTLSFFNKKKEDFKEIENFFGRDKQNLQNLDLQNQKHKNFFLRQDAYKETDLPWLNPTNLLSQDIALIIRKLSNCKIIAFDDIDDLNNQRVRTSSDQIQQQIRVGILRLKKTLTKLLCTYPSGVISNQNLTDFLNGSLREFFGSNPLSQFLDQTNPLAELTHKRRISKLGIGGIQRDSATLKVRTIHSTYFGRICPIETPEGVNAGLVNSLTCLSRINQKGQLITPFSPLIEGQKQEHFLYYSNKQDIPLSTTDTPLLRFQRLPNQFISTINKSQFQSLTSNKVKLRVKSDLQTTSLATALIPFLAYDDANRALMGSNMQRQAVPLILPERPIIRTGLESVTINDSGHNLESPFVGFISYISAQYIIILKAPLNKLKLIK